MNLMMVGMVDYFTRVDVDYDEVNKENLKPKDIWDILMSSMPDAV